MPVVANYRFDGKVFLAYCPSETDNPFVDFECSLTTVLKLIADFDHTVDADSFYTGIVVGLVGLVVE